MHARTATGRLLHEEHHHAIAVLDGLQSFLDATSDASMAAVSDVARRQSIEALRRFIVHELEPHLSLEDQIFPLIQARGGFELVSIFAGEHACIRPISRRLRGLCTLALDDGLDPETWLAFRSFAGVLIRELMSHIEREETTLLPAIDETVDPALDQELVAAYRDAAAAIRSADAS